MRNKLIMKNVKLLINGQPKTDNRELSTENSQPTTFLSIFAALN